MPLFIAHPSFFVNSDRTQALVWIDTFASALKKNGLEITFFDPLKHKVKDFDSLCFFSNQDPETWFELKKLGKTISVFPSLNQTPPRFILLEQVRQTLFQIKQALSQKKWPPYNDRLFFQSADHYFVTQAWKDFVTKVWLISSEKIALLPHNATEAARSFHDIA